MTTPTIPLPLINGISNKICFGIIEYFTEYNEWTKKVFGSAQYIYNKDDLASVQRPSIMCKPLNWSKNSYSYYVDGMIEFEIHFSLKDKRTNLTTIATEITDLILLIIVNQDLTRYLQGENNTGNNVMHGLFYLGKETNSDYSQLYSNEAIVKLTLNYRVDLQAYQNELNQKGFDITSPDEQIYKLAQFLQIENNLIPSNQEIVL
jgi:hypothetical protein